MSREIDRVTPLHGAGGELMDRLLREHVIGRFAERNTGRIGLSALDDGATVDVPDRGELVVTTDSHVVKPVRFPGGDIGRLAAAGTINDLAVMGARPLALTLGLILEVGFPLGELDEILASFAAVLDEVDVPLICGDTKVMGKGELDRIAINTTGIGVAATTDGRAIGDASFSVGDRVLVTGTIGDHGMALMACREEFRLQTTLESDVAPLWPILEPVVRAGVVVAMKDPTRGGLASALNDMARKSGTCIEIVEDTIPVRPEAQGLSDLLGISPLEVANEGKAILVVRAAAVDRVLTSLRVHPLGANAVCIGEVTGEYPRRVILDTGVGGRRFLEMPLGDPVPRIC